MKRFIIITLLLLCSGYGAYAQQSDEDLARSGSIYSRIGIGYPIDFGSSSADGMGLTGVSFSEPFMPALANPAEWGGTVYGMATGGVGLQNFDATDNQGSSRNTLFSANYFQLQLPLLRNKVGVSASVRPYSRTAYNLVTTETRIIGSGSTQDTLTYQTQDRGDGGVNLLELGAGWKINSNLLVGYAASLVFASIDNEISTIFAGNEFVPVQFNRQTSGIGFGNRFGALLRLPGVLKKNDQISIGASVSLPVSLNAEREEQSNKRLSDGSSETVIIKEGGSLGDGDIELPLKLAGGITYQPSRLFSISSEGIYEKWSDFKFDFNAEAEQMTTDRYKIGMGFRYFPYISDSDNFFSNFKYRLGASYDAGHLKINNQRIETLMLSLGLGILSSKSNSSIDVSFQYGIRGTRDQNLVKENIWGISLSLNLAELMFFRPKLK